MRKMSIRATGALALTAAAWVPGTIRAASVIHPPPPASTQEFIIDDGEYGPAIGDPPYSGDIFIKGNSISSADILLGADSAIPTPALQFDSILSQHTDSGNLADYDLDLVDTTGNYELALILDNAADLFTDMSGATVDPLSELETYPGGAPLTGNFSSTLDVPAPAALPVFVSALGLLGVFGRRRKRPTVEA